MATLAEQLDEELKKNRSLSVSSAALGGNSSIFSDSQSVIEKLQQAEDEYVKQKALYDQRALSGEGLLTQLSILGRARSQADFLLQTVMQSSNDLSIELLTLQQQSAVKSQPSRSTGKKKKLKFRLKLKQFSTSYKPKPISALTAGERLTNLTSLSSFKSLSTLKPLTA